MMFFAKYASASPGIREDERDDWNSFCVSLSGLSINSSDNDVKVGLYDVFSIILGTMAIIHHFLL